MAITAASLLLCGNLRMVTKTGNLSLGEIFTRIRATAFPTTEQSVIVYCLLVGEPRETGFATFECHEVANGLRLLHADDEVEMGQDGKRSVAVHFDRFRFPRPGDYRFTLTCNDQVIAEQTLPVLLAEGHQ
jgi:hypothetical protein